jgi:RNA polymerase sigma-70 factor, ECF subfamily
MEEMRKGLTHLTDKELTAMLSADKQSQQAAFTEIYDRYSKKVFAYIMRVLYNRDQAEDVFQETFLRFYSKVSSDYHSGTLIGFLITIARNLCLNIKRDKKATVPIEDFEFLVADTPVSEDKELEKLVKMAVELLDMEYREPLILRVYNGLSYEEIAELCHISPGNARIRTMRAKDKLKQILTPYLKEIY